ncbi:HalOD1 output domain-containing protein [Halorussus salinisoli]|uniref:HalOD1 output domain-containing protein n=1 Tax=Halorussus salinisoli TaxID=2558242 RepID=UPI0010C20EF3|nr:HalOD1 output domain-containing protein [Halorussus salinisoli]
MSVATNDANSEILYRTYHDRNRDGPISDAVVEALAVVENVEPEDLDVRLYDSVDGDALDSLYRTTAERSERLSVTFTIAAYEVEVADDGQVVVRERADDWKQDCGNPASR